MKSTKTLIIIDRDSFNPIHVTATISGDYEFPRGWDFSIDKIHSVELVIGDKQGVDITKQVMSNARSLALIEAQVADEDEQIIEALEGLNDANVQIDEMLERRQAS
jgi:hypothetical protein